jgi:putative transposase
MGLRYVEGATHDYICHGTITLFAALDVVTGSVIVEYNPRQLHQVFLSFYCGSIRRSRLSSTCT